MRLCLCIFSLLCYCYWSVSSCSVSKSVQWKEWTCIDKIQSKGWRINIVYYMYTCIQLHVANATKIPYKHCKAQYVSHLNSPCKRQCNPNLGWDQAIYFYFQLLYQKNNNYKKSQGNVHPTDVRASGGSRIFKMGGRGQSNFLQKMHENENELSHVCV